MTPQERQLVSVLGETEFANIFDLVLMFICYGAYILGFIIAVRSLTIGTWGRPQTVLLACLITTFICFSWDVFNAGAVVLELDWYTLEQGITGQTQAADKKVMEWQVTSGWPSIINLLLSDGIVVWRASTLYARSKFWRFILATLMIANISINVADTIWDIFNEETEFSKSAILDWVAVGLSLIVNMVATVLFSYKAWKHRRYMDGVNGGLARRGAQAQKILNLLVESGVIFCIVQSFYVIVIALDTCDITTMWPRNTVDTVFIIASSCYPVTVIGLLHKDNKRLASAESFNTRSSLQSDDICFSTIRGSNGIVSSIDYNDRLTRLESSISSKDTTPCFA